MAYGDNRAYPQIEIWRKHGTGWRYHGTTTWAKTCKEAKARFLDLNPDLTPELVKTNFKHPH